MRLIAGVDEAGRGPLAGDVVAAAVILDPAAPIPGLADSKALTARRRELLFDQILETSLCYAIARATVAEIDRLNILQASLLAMTRAVDALQMQPCHVLVDGNRLPQWRYSSEAIVQGDSLEAAISAASILAKVTRDRDMQVMCSRYPGYGFSAHKGYPTRAHLAALKTLGPSAIHRTSYAPVRNLMMQTSLF